MPFLSLMSKDIYFSNEAHAKFTETSQINFEKLTFISDPLVTLVIQKQKMRKIRSHDALQKYVKSVPVCRYKWALRGPVLRFSSTTLLTVLLHLLLFVCSEAELFRLSVEAEPPDKSDKSRTMARLKLAP